MLVLYHLLWICIVRCFADLVTDYKGEAVRKKADSNPVHFIVTGDNQLHL
jgi:hypothetical protein